MSIFREMGMREGEDRINEEVVYNIARIYSLIDRVISDLLSKYELSSAKFNILLVVKHVGGKEGIAQNEISKKLLVTTSNVTRMIDRLEKEKLVRRVALEGDRRVKRILITEKGAALLDKTWPPYKKAVDGFVDPIYNDREKKRGNTPFE
jgi:DNA-binding MarR family transcriptional regulator